jgi:hypothetical protein
LLSTVDMTLLLRARFPSNKYNIETLPREV